MKISGILLSSLIVLAILPNIGHSLAESTISIETNQSTYEYGDHLVMIIKILEPRHWEPADDDARIYITDPEERRSLLLQQPIYQEHTEFPSNFPFDATIWKPGTYVLELEYLEDKSSTQFIIEETGKIALPFWIKDLAHMWVTEPLVTDKDFARALEYLIEKEIIKIPYTQPGSETVSSIPEWVKTNAKWWIEGKISDTEFALSLQYLVKTGIITVNLSKA